jgi:hypothetical protein
MVSKKEPGSISRRHDGDLIDGAPPILEVPLLSAINRPWLNNPVAAPTKEPPLDSLCERDSEYQQSHEQSVKICERICIPTQSFHYERSARIGRRAGMGPYSGPNREMTMTGQRQGRQNKTKRKALAERILIEFMA